MSVKIWKAIFATTFLTTMLMIGYTVWAGNREIEFDMGCLDTQPDVISTQEATDRLVKRISAAKVLSEDYILTNEIASLPEIEAKFDKQLSAFDMELERLSDSDDFEMEWIVAKLIKLRVRFDRDAKDMFLQHRIQLEKEIHKKG